MCSNNIDNFDTKLNGFIPSLRPRVDPSQLFFCVVLNITVIYKHLHVNKGQKAYSVPFLLA